MNKIILIFLVLNLVSCGAVYIQPNDKKYSSIIRVDDKMTFETINKQIEEYKNSKAKGFISLLDVEMISLKSEMLFKSITGDLTGISKVDGLKISRVYEFTDIVRVRPGKRKLFVTSNLKNFNYHNIIFDFKQGKEYTLMIEPDGLNELKSTLVDNNGNNLLVVHGNDDNRLKNEIIHSINIGFSKQ